MELLTEKFKKREMERIITINSFGKKLFRFNANQLHFSDYGDKYGYYYSVNKGVFGSDQFEGMVCDSPILLREMTTLDAVELLGLHEELLTKINNKF